MKSALLVLLLAGAACGSAIAPAAGTPLSVPQLKFAVLDAAGKPAYCDPDYYPLAREGGEQQNAIAEYPQIKADTETYAAIVAHEHLHSGDLTDQQKLTVYRAWKLLRVMSLTPSGSDYTFQYKTQAANAYQMVAGSVRADGAVTVSSRTQTKPLECPICLAASTLIATPSGPVRVTEIRAGTVVWSQAADGSRAAEPVVEVGSIEAPAGHMVVDLGLADGREVWVSPGHRTADGRPVGSLKVGDSLDGSVVADGSWCRTPAGGPTTSCPPAPPVITGRTESCCLARWLSPRRRAGRHVFAQNRVVSCGYCTVLRKKRCG